ncbi:MAG: FKBP-type peptidyl-prolyl cis-trans isomerase [Alistipes finegoldii]
MQLVGKGGTITLWIPADLAYGARGAGRDIGPNEALEFEVELIDVVPSRNPLRRIRRRRPRPEVAPQNRRLRFRICRRTRAGPPCCHCAGIGGASAAAAVIIGMSSE